MNFVLFLINLLISVGYCSDDEDEGCPEPSRQQQQRQRLPTLDELVDVFDLQPHPWGGFFRETFRSSSTVTSSFGANRSSTTSIGWLEINRLFFQRLRQDEIWNFYAGDPLMIYELDEKIEGNLRIGILGNNNNNNNRRGNGVEDSTNNNQTTTTTTTTYPDEVVQHTFKAGTWFASEILNSHNDSIGYSFVGITDGPGFEFEDFQVGVASQLIEQYPEAPASLITEMSASIAGEESERASSSTTPTAIKSTTSVANGGGCPQAQPTLEELVERYNMTKHPEGGFFVETFRSKDRVQTEDDRNRSAITAILSADVGFYFHRLKSDETWHYYDIGLPLLLHELVNDNASMMKTTILGSNILAGEVPQYTVEAGTWFAGEVKISDNQTGDDDDDDDDYYYAFVGTMVTPGFEFEDWEEGVASDLIALYPAAADNILELTPPEEEDEEDGEGMVPATDQPSSSPPPEETPTNAPTTSSGTVFRRRKCEWWLGIAQLILMILFLVVVR